MKEIYLNNRTHQEKIDAIFYLLERAKERVEARDWKTSLKIVEAALAVCAEELKGE